MSGRNCVVDGCHATEDGSKGVCKWHIKMGHVASEEVTSVNYSLNCVVDDCHGLKHGNTEFCKWHFKEAQRELERSENISNTTDVETKGIKWGEVAKFGIAAAVGLAAFNNRQGQDGAFTGAFSAAVSAYNGDFASAVNHSKPSVSSKTYSCTCGYAIQGGSGVHASPKCPRCNKMMIQGGHRVISSVAQCSNCGATISSHSGITGKCIDCSKEAHIPVTGTGSYSCQCGVIERANSYSGSRKCRICGRQMTFKQ